MTTPNRIHQVWLYRCNACQDEEWWDGSLGTQWADPPQSRPHVEREPHGWPNSEPCAGRLCLADVLAPVLSQRLIDHAMRTKLRP